MSIHAYIFHAYAVERWYFVANGSSMEIDMTGDAETWAAWTDTAPCQMGLFG